MSLTIVGVAIFHQATTAVIPWFIDGERMSCLFWRGVFPPSSKQKGKEFVDARFKKETRTNLRTVQYVRFKILANSNRHHVEQTKI